MRDGFKGCVERVAGAGEDGGGVWGGDLGQMELGRKMLGVSKMTTKK